MEACLINLRLNQSKPVGLEVSGCRLMGYATFVLLWSFRVIFVETIISLVTLQVSPVVSYAQDSLKNEHNFIFHVRMPVLAIDSLTRFDSVGCICAMLGEPSAPLCAWPLHLPWNSRAFIQSFRRRLSSFVNAPQCAEGKLHVYPESSYVWLARQLLVIPNRRN